MVAADLRSRLKFSSARYEQMIELGVLTQQDRVELIEGEIVEMSPIGPSHNACTDLLTEKLVLALAGKAIIRIQGAVHLTEDSMPESDVAILHYREDRYRAARPTPDDIYALIEVSDSTLDFDRTVKRQLYAEAGVREYWIVDVRGESLWVHRQPSDRGYEQSLTLTRDDQVQLEAFPDVSFAVSTLLP